MLRPDQIAMLNDLAERLADVFITEADPVNWTGAGRLPCDMSPQERGDRHWDRKGAMGTGGVLNTTLQLIRHHGDENDTTADDEDLDRKIEQAQARAKKAIERAMNPQAGKAEFDRRTHGKAKG